MGPCFTVICLSQQIIAETLTNKPCFMFLGFYVAFSLVQMFNRRRGKLYFFIDLSYHAHVLILVLLMFEVDACKKLKLN